MERLAKTLSALDNTFGVSGEEEAVAAQIKKELEGFYDSCKEDALGNIILTQNARGGNKKIALAAHMDEIGFIVRYIDDNGQLLIAPVGYHDDRMLINQDVEIKTKDGMIEGVTGYKPAHMLKGDEGEKVIPFDSIYVDVGTLTRAETEKLGVRIGDYGHYQRTGKFINGGKIYTGKSVDNRVGCTVICEVMRRAKEAGIKNELTLIGTVQEEVGARGAGVAGFEVKPDVAIVVDVTIAGGASGLELSECCIELGKGPAIKYYDWDMGSTMGNNVSKKMTRAFEAVAEKNNIEFQREVLINGGTDGWTLATSASGVLTGIISVPQRYMHTAVGTVHIDDLEGAVDLILKYIQSID